VEWVAAERERGQGVLQLDIDLGDMASPRMTPGAAQGVSIIARPWPQGGPLFSPPAFPLDFHHSPVTCPNGQTVPMLPGRDAQCPASACAPCPVRAQCPKARIGQGRSLTIRADEPFQQKLRAKLQTKRGRASRRKRTAVEHAISQQWAHQGRRARYKGLRKNQFDGRRHAAVSNLQGAAHYEEERQLAS
jgi:Transposase DDE domain